MMLQEDDKKKGGVDGCIRGWTYNVHVKLKKKNKKRTCLLKMNIPLLDLPQKGAF